MEQQTIKSIRCSKNIWIIVTSILVAILIVGGGMFLWQQKKFTNIQNDLEILKQQITNFQSKLEGLKITSESEVNSNSSIYCTKKPIPTEIGRDIYPINIEKYGNIGFLGELFTADDCGQNRVSLIFGVDGDNYTLWPDIGLKDAPSKGLLSVLQLIGFEPINCDDSQNISTCKYWSLKKIVPLDKILKLKPYAKEIESSGCINCG